MLSVIVISYNTKKLLASCLSSLRKNLPQGAEIIVVDNASKDGSAAMVQQDFPSVRVLMLDQNRGFGAANNLGMSEAHGDIFWLLNSDTQVGNSPEDVLDFMRKPQVGIVGNRLILPDGSLQKYVCGKFYNIFTPILKLLPGRSLPWESREISAVDWVTGASLFLKRKVFEALHGFDEDFFMYFEDQDLCLRAKKQGFGVFFYPHYAVKHYSGASFAGSKRASKVAYYRSLRLFFEKHRPPWERWLLGKLLSVWEKVVFGRQ